MVTAWPGRITRTERLPVSTRMRSTMSSPTAWPIAQLAASALHESASGGGAGGGIVAQAARGNAISRMAGSRMAMAALQDGWRECAASACRRVACVNARSGNHQARRRWARRGSSGIVAARRPGAGDATHGFHQFVLVARERDPQPAVETALDAEHRPGRKEHAMA